MRGGLPQGRTGRPAASAGRPEADRGSSPIEELLVLPALMLLVMTAMQFALYGLSLHAASLALSEGAAEARAAGGGLKAGERLVSRDLSRIAPHLLVAPRFSVHRSTGHPTTLMLSGRVPSVVPGLHLTVHVASAGLDQRFEAG